MTRDDIIRMAHESGLHLATDHDWMPIIALAYAEKFFNLAYAAGAADEREACAKICDAAQLFGNDDERWSAKCCSEAIRARGQE